MNNQDIIDYVMDTPHNTNPVILKQKLNEQDFENRSDWNQNDPTKPDYVKNRTHYTEVTEEILFDGDVVFHHNAQPQTWYPLGKTPIIEGDIYKVNWNGAVFECQATLLENYVGFGNPYIFKPTVYADQDNGMPFYVLYAGGALTCGVLTPEIKFSASFYLSRCEEVVHKIPEKYLPDGIGGGSGADLTLLFDYKPGRAGYDDFMSKESGRIISGSIEQVVDKFYVGLPVKIDMYGICTNNKESGAVEYMSRYGIADDISIYVNSDRSFGAFRFNVRNFFDTSFNEYGSTVYLEADGTTHREWD